VPFGARGGVDVVPLQGASVVCYGGGGEGDDPIQKMRPKKNCFELLANLTLFSTLITQKLAFAIWGLCWSFFYQLTYRRLPKRGTNNKTFVTNRG